jgi:NAD(P)-dependent dehydrogenase (short-subunit alcohol dehydrogenase family)
MKDYKDQRLKGKVAIVTGSARGIGEGIAVRFAQEGAKLVINSDKKKATEGRKVAEKIKDMGEEAIFIEADISKEEDVKNIIGRTIEIYGKIDILVNNAGVAITKPIEKCSIEDYDFVQNVDLRGLWLCCREVVEPMKSNGGGKIINIASTSGVIAPFPNQSIYCAAKGGVIQLTRALAIELCKYNINVNCIAPSFIDTPIYEELDWSLRNPKNLKKIINLIPCGRVGTIEECGGAAFFLASEDSSFVMGQTIFVDGGLVSW